MILPWAHLTDIAISLHLPLNPMLNLGESSTASAVSGSFRIGTTVHSLLAVGYHLCESCYRLFFGRRTSSALSTRAPGSKPVRVSSFFAYSGSVRLSRRHMTCCSTSVSVSPSFLLSDGAQNHTDYEERERERKKEREERELRRTAFLPVRCCIRARDGSEALVHCAFSRLQL